MQETLSFGKCLALFLSVLNIKSSRVAKTLNVDPSLINRWIHGSRVPPNNSDYINKISHLIFSNIQSSYQVKRAEEILNLAGMEWKQGMDLYQGIRDCLIEVLNQTLNVQRVCHPTDDNDIIIQGSNHILKTLLSSLESAAGKPCPPGAPPIMLTFFNPEFAKVMDDHYLSCLFGILSEALQNHWMVTMVFQIGNHPEQIVRIARLVSMLPMFQNISVYYLDKYDTATFSNEFYIIPGTGVLSCYCGSCPWVDSALFLTSTSAENMFLLHLNKIITYMAKPLLKYYFPGDGGEYFQAVSVSERIPGKTFLSMDSFNESTIPFHLCSEYLKHLNMLPSERSRLLELHAGRTESFHKNLHQFEHREIYSRSSIDRCIEERTYSLGNLPQINMPELHPGILASHLENIAGLLKRFDNYKVAFVDQHPINQNNWSNTLIKERHCVHVKLNNKTRECPHINVFVDEPTLVNALEKYHSGTWEKISYIHKDKKDIINWLESRIRVLQESVLSY